MFALVSAVFAASLLGSMHCVGMCGAFLAFAVVGGPDDATPRWLLQGAYHAGRLVTYTILGLLAGLLGSAIDLGGELVGVQRSAAIAAGACMIVFGTVAVARQLGLSIPRVPVPAIFQRAVASGHRRIDRWSPVARSISVGLLTTLLPCGWLYAFAITAAGTGHPAWGALTMGVFWMGTLPALIALGTGLQHASGALRRHIPVLTSLLLVGVGVWTLAGRIPMIGRTLATHAAVQSPTSPDIGAQASQQGVEEACHGR